MSFGSGVGSVFMMGIKFMYPNTKPQMILYRFGRSHYEIT